MSKDDIFYYDTSDKYAEYRDPEIFEYIQITDNKIIELIKNYKIMTQFFNLKDRQKEN